jgi:hypothetical protein
VVLQRGWYERVWLLWVELCGRGRWRRLRLRGIALDGTEVERDERVLSGRRVVSRILGACDIEGLQAC